MAPAQTGKTFTCLLIPLFYYLFIKNEKSIIFAVPNRTIGNDIQKRILTAMKISPYLRQYIPKSGKGSEGGYSERIEFINGSILYFVTSNGNDKARSSISARVIFLTETDGYDSASEGGQESDRISQILLRSNAFGDNARIYYDCSPSNKKGRIYQEFIKGTQTEIEIECQLCKEYYIPDDKCLIYPTDAENVNDIYGNVFVKCPKCGYMHNEKERIKSVNNHRLKHNNPESKNFSVHLNCIHNLLVSLDFIAEKIYEISKRPDTKNAQQLLNQAYWGIPYDDISQKSQLEMMEDFNFDNSINDDLPINRISSNYSNITCSIDVGKHLFYYSVCGYDNISNKMHVINYGEIETNYNTIQDEYKAFDLTLSQIKSLTDIDYIDENNTSHRILFYGADTGYNTKIMYDLCKKHNILSLKGYSEIKNRYNMKYKNPDNTTENIIHRGNQYHISKVDNKTSYLFHLNASYYKEKLHDYILSNNFSVYSESALSHNRLYKHISSERKILDRNNNEKWVKVYESNHLLDCLAYSILLNEYIKEIEYKD